MVKSFYFPHLMAFSILKSCNHRWRMSFRAREHQSKAGFLGTVWSEWRYPPKVCGQSVYNINNFSHSFDWCLHRLSLSRSSFLCISPLVICSAGPSIGCARFALSLGRAEREAFDETAGEASRLFTAGRGAGGCGGVIAKVGNILMGLTETGIFFSVFPSE